MNITLTWDLFVLVFFIVIIAYSFIIGRNYTLKIIISTYIAILAADGVGNILERFMSPRITSLLLPGIDFLTASIVLKILIFVGAIVILAMKGEFSVNLEEHGSYTMMFFINLLFGVLSAGLIVSTILYFMSGGSFLETAGLLTNEAMLSIKRQSRLVSNLVDHYNIWFSLPAIVFGVASFLKRQS